jgi:large subunit ribosomal protein L27
MKIYGGQPVKAGGIIFRQTGSTWHEGTNTGCGVDYTIYSKVEGIVIYDKKKKATGRQSVRGREAKRGFAHDHRERPTTRPCLCL